MQIDPRLNKIDDCLYRVATKALIMQNDKVLLVQETPELWWGFPGGGVDHGETVESSLAREIEEELGLPAKAVSSDYEIAYYSIGQVVHGVPRMNLFYKVSLPTQQLRSTDDIATWAWFSKDEFMVLHLNPSYDKARLAGVIFGA